jgi:hypothetical protein
MRFMTRHLNYANVASTLALFLVLGGTAAAANKYLLTTKKQISPTLLKSLHGSVGARGLQGLQGAAGATGSKGDMGAKGDTGDRGVPGPLLQIVPSGVTIHGAWGFEGEPSGYYLGAVVSYPLQLPAPPTGAVFSTDGLAKTHCPGSVSAPAADPGYLCVYRGYDVNALVGYYVGNPETGARSATSVYGFNVEDATTAGTGTAIDEGTYAYQAP